MTHVLKLKRSLALAGALALAGTFALAQFGFSASAQAGNKPKPKPVPPAKHGLCSLATLKGLYVASQTGWQVAGKPRGPFGSAGIYVFDGMGHAQGTATRNLSGIVSRVSFRAKYILRPDCSGAIVLQDNTGAVRHYDIYTTPSGSRFTYERTDPGVVGTGSATSS